MVEFTTLETARLRIRRFQDSDLQAFLAYRNDPEVARYQSWESTSEEEGRSFIEEMKSSQPGSIGLWFQFAFELKATGTLIGDCGLVIALQDERQGEIGYTLSRAYQRQGLATEGVTAVLDYAFTALNMHRVSAVVDTENAASVALLERIGMRCEAHFVQNIWFKGKYGDEYWYAVLGDEWRRRQMTETRSYEE